MAQQLGQNFKKLRRTYNNFSSLQTMNKMTAHPSYTIWFILGWCVVDEFTNNTKHSASLGSLIHLISVSAVPDLLMKLIVKARSNYSCSEDCTPLSGLKSLVKFISVTGLGSQYLIAIVKTTVKVIIIILWVAVLIIITNDIIISAVN